MNVPPVSGTSLADKVVTRLAEGREAIEKAQAKATDKLVNTTANAPGISADQKKPGAILNIFA